MGRNSSSIEELESKPPFSNSSFHWYGISSSRMSTNSSREILNPLARSQLQGFTDVPDVLFLRFVGFLGKYALGYSRK
eukprot:9896636-Ditylum_brightwellii.AAC.1